MSRLANVLAVAGPTNTVNAATATLATLDVSSSAMFAAPNNCGFYVEGIWIGRDTATNLVTTMRSARAFKNIAAVLTALGAGITAIVPPVGDAALLAAVPLLNVTGTTIRQQVTGVLTFTIEWTGSLRIYSGEFVG